MNPFQSLRDYETFIYALPEQFPNILHSMLVVVQRGRSYAELSGEVLFADAYRLVVYERLTYWPSLNRRLWLRSLAWQR